MSGQEVDWSQPEIVRAINRLTRAMERFEESVDDTFREHEQRYVLREVYDRDMAALRDDRNARRSWVRDLVAPTVTGLIVGVLVLIASAAVH